MRSQLPISISNAQFTLSPAHAPPLEYPQPTRSVMPESKAAGGDRFQYWRRYRTGAYVQDALPTEIGYTSCSYYPVQYSKIQNSVGKLAYVHNCQQTTELFSYSDSTVKGIADLPTGTVIWLHNGTVVQGTDQHAVDVKGVQADSPAIKDVVGIHNRLIIHDGHFIYWSSSENPFDFTPSLSTGAGSAGVVDNIGIIVKLVVAYNGFYVLGTRGGMFAKCSEDTLYPFNLVPIRNFSGIPNPEAIYSHYNATKLLVWSNSGLQWLEEGEASNDFPDVSMQLSKGIYTELGFNVNTSDKSDVLEYLDNGCDKIAYNPLYSSLSSTRGVMVHNVSPRYVTVSYAKLGDNYTRVYVIDSYLDRCSVLHKHHTFVINKLYDDGTVGWIFAKGKTVDHVDSGDNTAYIYLHEFARLDAQSEVVTRVNLFGDFYASKYSDQFEACDGNLLDIVAVQGVDRLSSSLTSHMNLAISNRREIRYSGKLRQHVLSMIIPFCGWLSEITLA